MRRLVLAATAAALAASSALAATPKVAASDAWCRAAPAGAPAGGCYVTLRSVGDDRLIGVETEAFTRAEIHTMSMDGGVMRMRRLAEGLPLPAGRAVALRPGGEHLMLIGPKAPLSAGGQVSMTLIFAKAPSLRLTVPVQAVGPATDHGGHR